MPNYSLTRKHFEAIAEILAQYKDYSGVANISIAHSLASYLATQNPNFNREKFLAKALGEKKYCANCGL